MSKNLWKIWTSNIFFFHCNDHCNDFTYDTTYRAWEEDAVLEMTEEVGNEEAAQHQAHREQGSVGVSIDPMAICVFGIRSGIRVVGNRGIRVV